MKFSPRFACSSLTLALLLACGGGGGGGSQPSASGPGGSWEGPQQTEVSAFFDAWYPSVAMDGTGRALTTWYQDSGGTSAIWARAYAPASGGWQGYGTIEPALYPAYTPDVAINPNGTGMIVWQQSDGSTNRIYGMPYQTGVAGTYGSKDLVSTTATAAEAPSVAINANGTGVVTWVQSDGTHYETWACIFDQTHGWGTPTQLEASSGEESITPSAAIDDAGNAIVVWQRAANLSTGPYTVWASRFMGNAWAANPTQLHASSGDEGNPSVAMGPTGAIATWTETLDAGNSYQIHVSRWTAGSDAWTAPTRVSPTTEMADMPSVAMDAQGNALLVWQQSFGGLSVTHASIAASQFTPASGWSGVRRLDSINSNVGIPALAMNAAGSANIVWQQLDGSVYSIVGLRYAPAGGWGVPTLLESSQAGSAYAPKVCVGANGQAMATWYQKDANGLRSVFTNRFR